MSDLALTQPLRAWLREDPAWAALPWQRRARLAWAAQWGSWNAALSNALHPPEKPSLAPIFVLGPWRSGSTAMHELLARAAHLPCPRTWHCMNAAAFALGAPPASDRGQARPMDGLPIYAQSPQEDEFALLTLGAESVYRGFWQPQRLHALLPLLKASHWQRHREWLAPWDAFLSHVARLEGRNDRPLLLKSPNHTFRWPAIRQHFPSARAVWMLRDGQAVFHSNRKMWRQMAHLHGLQTVDGDALDRFLVAALLSSAEALRQALRNDDPIVVVTQSRLREHPADEVRRVCEWLELPLDEGGLAAGIHSVAGGREERYSGPLPPDALRAVAELDAAQSEALRLQGSVC